MRRSKSAAVAALAIAFLPLSGQGSASAATAAVPKANPQQQLENAWDDFRQAIADSTEFVRHSALYATPEDRASAYSFISSMMIARLEEDVIFDPDFPYFRVLDHRIREGGDNPDQRYLITDIRGGESYRIWGHVGSERRLEFQTYAGDPYVAGGGGHAAAYLNSDTLKIGPDRSFEVFLTPERRGANWLPNPADANQLLVREIYSDWSHETPGDIHIDRIGHEGDAKPFVDETMMAARLRKAASDLRTHVRVWPTMVAKRYLGLPNQLSKPFDPGSLGGVPGRFMVSGAFDLAPDEALVIHTWPASGNYQGIQLADLWFSSLEYANRQTSLTGDQAVKDADGSYWFVISAKDPGVPNWLDTMGRRRGVILLRFDGMKEKSFNPAHDPTAVKVKLADLRHSLPADTPHVTAAERATVLAERRHHVQLRFND